MACIRGDEVFHIKTKQKQYIYIYSQQMAGILTRSGDQMADSSSYEVFNLVWVVCHSTKINKYNKRIICILTRVFQRLGGRECHKIVLVLGGDGTKIAPPVDVFDQRPGVMS